MRKAHGTIVVRVLRAALALGIAVGGHPSHAGIALISFGADVRAENLGGDGERAELSLWWEWGQDDATAAPVRASVGEVRDPFATAESRVVRFQGSPFYTTLGVAAKSRARAPDPWTSTADPPSLAADASALGRVKINCVLETDGWLRVHGSGTITRSVVGDGRSESSVVVLALDASGAVVAEHLWAGESGPWSVAIDVPVTPGLYTIHVEWRGDALSASSRSATSASVEGAMAVHTLPGSPPRCLGDADANGVVNFQDLIEVLNYYGSDYGGAPAAGDSSLDGRVDFHDITETVTQFSSVCP